MILLPIMACSLYSYFWPWWGHSMEMLSSSFDIIFVISVSKLLSKQLVCWRFEMPWHSSDFIVLMGDSTAQINKIYKWQENSKYSFSGKIPETLWIPEISVVTPVICYQAIKPLSQTLLTTDRGLVFEGLILTHYGRETHVCINKTGHHWLR